MQLTLCVKRDLHGCIFLNKLLPQLAGHEIGPLKAVFQRWPKWHFSNAIC